MDVPAAQALGAGQVTAVVGNPLVIDAAADVYYQVGVNLGYEGTQFLA